MGGRNELIKIPELKTYKDKPKSQQQQNYAKNVRQNSR